MDTADVSDLPVGQQEIGGFPRFGLTQFTRRFPRDSATLELEIRGAVEQTLTIAAELLALPRVDQVSDFHCVTTWSYRAARWSGFRFADFYHQLVVPRTRPRSDARLVVFRCRDGYAQSLPLEDLLAGDVLLADRLDDRPLDLAHGAPPRLVAPSHYGYKNAKHLRAVELWTDDRRFRWPGLRFMDHPRARVAFEERGRGVPGWLLRVLYRPLVGPTIQRFSRALQDEQRRMSDGG
jgi:DMSO/TMAO reductase YedYZ molybdopterin-dependent catalytic subunit